MSFPQLYMARALTLARRGLFTADPNPLVGCVIVKNNQIIGEGWHQRAGEAHAEIHALNATGKSSKDADCYISLEPCSHFGRTPPCAETLIKAGVKRVYIAMQDPNPKVAGQGIAKLKEADIEVVSGILENQAKQLNRGFCKRMLTGRPFVRSKIAMSLDGRTAMASGESKWITGSAARQDVQKLRAQSSAIMTGMGTILTDNPSLTVRPEGDWYPKGQEIRDPLRIIIGKDPDIPEHAHLFDEPHEVLIVTTKKRERGNKTDVLIVPEKNGNVDLNTMMTILAKRGLNEIMVEAGAILNGALLAAGLIDELVIYMAPKFMGDLAKGLFHLPELQTMAQNIDLTITDMRAIGKDWRITATPNYMKAE